MESRKAQLRDLLERVFERTISSRKFRDEAAAELGVREGDSYPKFIWKADHYLTDEDLCNQDAEYEKMMREDILDLFEEHFSQNGSCSFPDL